jgi:hypothetical protein
VSLRKLIDSSAMLSCDMLCYPTALSCAIMCLLLSWYYALFYAVTRCTILICAMIYYVVQRFASVHCTTVHCTIMCYTFIIVAPYLHVFFLSSVFLL